MTPHITSGTFDQMEHAEDAQEYLLGNEFEEDQLKLEGLKLYVYTQTALEAQEAVDVLRNYGASDISMAEVAK
ncbi:hypothetical protein [Mucilaginibacter glaciei]|uniref:Uncharacterized protein n=1 Tax=Mucilaginibacter glaciei TaxID=2772109 RepID=A0A926NJR9_9SPHI|nr:hypothetical protein [Mucilaginibacter glaciei]MBD1393359.1 hypothetical protein [Mucilaginibacter glaciei]